MSLTWRKLRPPTAMPGCPSISVMISLLRKEEISGDKTLFCRTPFDFHPFFRLIINSDSRKILKSLPSVLSCFKILIRCLRLMLLKALA